MTQRIEEEEEALKPQEIRSRDIRHIKMNIPGFLNNIAIVLKV